MDDSSKSIHTENDALSTVSYEHMLEHAKLVVGFVVELGLTKGL